VIHYHGTPITPRAKLLQLAGRCFCVSYASPRDVAICHSIGQSVMLDNGAFTFWRQGGSPASWEPYYAWAKPWLDYWTTWAVIPDVIDGDEKDNDDLIEEWPFGHRGAPVWHLHEPLERLVRLSAAWPLVCLGSSGQFATPNAPAWQKRMADAMGAVTDSRGVPATRYHMLRGLALGGGRYPFFSADSTNIARNHAGSKSRASVDIRDMADRIDGKQTPALWQRDLTLF
jgi:hypothetical protein